MPPLQPFAAAWSRGGRREGNNPTTPEPCADGQAQPPSPPRPRFRVKRRNASNLNAPTQQFLASVAAADIPIPSIEEPRVLDEEMSDSMYPITQISDMDDMPLTPHGASGRLFSPPKTPAPDPVPALLPKQYPNWSLDSTISSLESSPDYESSRPSTAHSTQTSSSLSNFSVSIEDLRHCFAVDSEQKQPDQHGDTLSAEDALKTIKAHPSAASRSKLRKALWTPAMTQHLWSTYLMYLQDPKVTPFRLGKSGIPPHGVCLRVAREAKRSWKGTKSPQHDNVISASGSSTPTGQSLGVYVQWPHTCAATRAQLRDLCKANARTTSRTHQYLAHSPTPFGKASTRFLNRRSAPLRSRSVFSGQDMAMSLTVATAESMQLQGPLAQLTSSQPNPVVAAATDDELPPPRPQTELDGFIAVPGPEPLESERAPLASPFTARSYGPSSSSSLPTSFVVDSAMQRRTLTGARRRTLRSPLRLTRSPSTQKRRSKQPLLEPRRIKRPSLGSDLWVDPSTVDDDDIDAGVPRMPEFSSSLRDDRDELFVPRTNLQELFSSSQPHPQPAAPRPTATAATAAPAPAPAAVPPRPASSTLAPPAMEAPPRLGSPFSLTSSSFSFPNRLSDPLRLELGNVRRPFATVQQSSEAPAAPVSRSSLATRLAYIDERLKDFRRDRIRRRSESPL